MSGLVFPLDLPVGHPREWIDRTLPRAAPLTGAFASATITLVFTGGIRP